MFYVLLLCPGPPHRILFDANAFIAELNGGIPEEKTYRVSEDKDEWKALSFENAVKQLLEGKVFETRGTAYLACVKEKNWRLKFDMKGGIGSHAIGEFNEQGELVAIEVYASWELGPRININPPIDQKRLFLKQWLDGLPERFPESSGEGEEAGALASPLCSPRGLAR